jgi:hypothetical protein
MDSMFLSNMEKKLNVIKLEEKGLEKKMKRI